MVLLAALVAITPAAVAQSNTGTLIKFDFGGTITGADGVPHAVDPVYVDLFNNLSSATVNNFLNNYVTTSLLNNTVIHRSVQPPSDVFGIIQGGSFYPNGSSVPTVAPVNLDYEHANTQGTIAMARTTAPNSATSGYFFNNTDNTNVFGPSNGGGYAVFGWIVGNGLQTIQSIANLPTYGDSLPRQDYTQTDSTNQKPLTNANLVILNSVTVVQANHPAFQNPLLNTDVDNSGSLTAKDLSLVLEDLFIHQSHSLNTAFAGTNYLDVDGNGFVQPADAAKIEEAFALAGLLVQQPQGSPSSLVLLPSANVPEPSTLALGTAGLLALGAWGYRRRRVAA